MNPKQFIRKAGILLELLLLLVWLLPAGVQAAPGRSRDAAPASSSSVYLPLVSRNFTFENEITFWYAYGSGSAEEQSLNTVLAQAAIDLPQYKITALQVPFSDIYNNYHAAVAAGAGPDMFIAPNDLLGDEARAGYIADITSLTAGKLGAYTPLSVQGMSLDGKVYGIPESLKAVALWYDKSWLSTPPATTAALKTTMNIDVPVAVSYGCYHQWGFYGAFGGTVFDSNWKIAATNQGMVDAMTYLDELYQISKAKGWPRNDADGSAAFTNRTVAAVTNGNWAMGEYKAVLGKQLAVAALPAGPSGPATPMLGVDGFYINPNSYKQAAAVEVALYLSNAAAEAEMMKAGHVPAITTATITDPLIQSLKNIFLNTYVRPQVPQLGKYWENFCNTDEVFEDGMDPLAWLQKNTAAANAITIWHSYGQGSAEEQAFNAVLTQAAIDLPEYKIKAEFVPFNDLHDNYVDLVKVGRGPDMFVFPNDWLGEDARAGYITDITTLASDRLGDYSTPSVQGMSLDSKLYGIPESLKALAFWYNKALMATPPATTAALKTLMTAGTTPVALSYGCYHQWGFYGAFGGTVFESNWKIDATNQGMVDAMTYLDELYQISKANGWPKTDAEGFVPFTTGQVAAITNGNWAMGDYHDAMGANLGVAALPAGPYGPSTPMLGVDGYFVNPNSQQKADAVEVALFMTSAAAEGDMMQAGHVPAITTATITDPLIQSLQTIFLNGYPRPQVPQLGKYWENFCNTDQVFESGMDPLVWLTNATNAANP